MVGLRPIAWAVTYSPSDDRYDTQPYRRCGRSGLKLPAVSLGFWHNFGDDKPLERQRSILREAFDLGVTHFDLANNYGPPYGAAEENFGRNLRERLRDLRDELVISSKAGWDMWPGPYGRSAAPGSTCVASLDQSLKRLGLEYVDIFYHHRPDPATPWRRRWARWTPPSGPARRSTSGSRRTPPSTRPEGRRHPLANSGTPLTIHQPSYSMFNRWIETRGLIEARARAAGFGRPWWSSSPRAGAGNDVPQPEHDAATTARVRSPPLTEDLGHHLPGHALSVGLGGARAVPRRPCGEGEIADQGGREPDRRDPRNKGAQAWHREAGVVEVQAPTVDVVDTIGAGDSFQAALLFALRALGRIGRQALAQTNSDELDRVLSFAASCAAFTCGRAGADPPRRSEVGAALSRLIPDFARMTAAPASVLTTLGNPRR